MLHEPVPPNLALNKPNPMAQTTGPQAITLRTASRRRSQIRSERYKYESPNTENTTYAYSTAERLTYQCRK